MNTTLTAPPLSFLSPLTIRYGLCTRIEHPHDDAITGLTFRPQNFNDRVTAVTVGENGVIKIWEKKENDGQRKFIFSAKVTFLLRFPFYFIFRLLPLF